ncbi:hypothetical protein NN561_014044 [Cricetulus griseus]
MVTSPAIRALPLTSVACFVEICSSHCPVHQQHGLSPLHLRPALLLCPQLLGGTEPTAFQRRQRRTLFGARCGAGMSVARWRDAGCSGQGASHSVPVLATTVTCAGSKQPEERLDTEFQTVFFFLAKAG